MNFTCSERNLHELLELAADRLDTLALPPKDTERIRSLRESVLITILEKEEPEEKICPFFDKDHVQRGAFYRQNNNAMYDLSPIVESGELIPVAPVITIRKFRDTLNPFIALHEISHLFSTGIYRRKGDRVEHKSGCLFSSSEIGSHHLIENRRSGSVRRNEILTNLCARFLLRRAGFSQNIIPRSQMEEIDSIMTHARRTGIDETAILRAYLIDSEKSPPESHAFIADAVPIFRDGIPLWRNCPV